MGPTQVDPLAHARSIVRKCMVRDAFAELVAREGTQSSAMSRAFGRPSDGLSFEASSTESLSSSGERTAKPTAKVTKVRTAALFALACIIIVALVASRSLGVHY